MDFIARHLEAFYQQTDWNPRHQLSQLHVNTRSTSSEKTRTTNVVDVLDFRPPWISFHCTLNKSITPHLKSAYSLGLPQRRSVGFLYTSCPLSVSSVDPSSTWVTDTSLGKPLAPTLVFGRLHEDARLEALVVRRTSPHSQLLWSGMNSWSGDGGSQMFLQWQQDLQPWATELNFHSIGQLVGVQGVYHLPGTPLSLGAEVFYTHAERSGGLSFTARYQKENVELGCTDLSLVLNPMMGHFTSSFYVGTPWKSLELAARYDFNMHSYESDLTAGFIFSPRDKNQSLKVRVGQTTGLGLCWEARVGQQLSLAVGVTTGLQSLGVQLQYSLE